MDTLIIGAAIILLCLPYAATSLPHLWTLVPLLGAGERHQLRSTRNLGYHTKQQKGHGR